ncbi:MAG: GrpB family protein [Lentisphaerota bacterium]
METIEQKVQRVVAEVVEIAPYNPEWPRLFEEEKAHLLSCLPRELIRRIEHFGSTAVPGMAAKPIVDMLIEANSLEVVQQRIVPILESQGYDYFWRPSWGDDTPPFYAWFIKRNPQGLRTHHLHMVERNFDHWDRLLFKDYLVSHPEAAAEYQTLKLKLAKSHPNDRISYTRERTAFIVCTTEIAKQYYSSQDSSVR